MATSARLHEITARSEARWRPGAGADIRCRPSPWTSDPVKVVRNFAPKHAHVARIRTKVGAAGADVHEDAEGLEPVSARHQFSSNFKPCQTPICSGTSFAPEAGAAHKPCSISNTLETLPRLTCRRLPIYHTLLWRRGSRSARMGLSSPIPRCMAFSGCNCPTPTRTSPHNPVKNTPGKYLRATLEQARGVYQTLLWRSQSP